MSRPKKCRRIEEAPRVTYFKPRGVPVRELNEVVLSVEGFEALRLAELEGLAMEDAARRMRISRHTFGRILAEARRIMAKALVGGHALRVGGGHYEIEAGAGAGPADKEELSMSKVAVSSEGPGLDDLVDPRFGRAGGFVVVDLETMASEYLDNGGSQALSHGAGIQTAERIAGAGAGVVLTGFVGPKAFQALAAAGIKVGQNLDGLTVRQAVDRYKAGSVPIAEGPNKGQP